VLLVLTYKPSLAEFTRDYQKSLYEVTPEPIAVDNGAQNRDPNTEKISVSVVSVLRSNRQNGKQSSKYTS